jgi:hypothetical protein
MDMPLENGESELLEQLVDEHFNNNNEEMELG